MTLAATGKGKS